MFWENSMSTFNMGEVLQLFSHNTDLCISTNHTHTGQSDLFTYVAYLLFSKLCEIVNLALLTGRCGA